MKIIKLRFKNLNSLYGEWEIDFSSTDYLNNGIFAITGPTGAGKSTIMDAICLALYGRTPRLAKVNQSSNEIISRKTGDCFSELTFSTRTGTFRAMWSQHRAYNKPENKLTPPEHELVDATADKVLESSITGVARAIIDHTGMDFDRFTRSMLLAQGGFAAFLQASPNERAPLLEEITGTEIYSRISIRAQNRQAEEKKKLDELTALSKGIILLTEEQIAETNAQIETESSAETTFAAGEKEHQAAIQWLEKKLQLELEIGEIEKRIVEINQNSEDFKPLQIKLNLALKANELEGEFAGLQAMRQNQAADQLSLEKKRQELEEAENALQNSRPAIEQSLQNAEKARQQFNELQQTLQQVRKLDLLIQGQLQQKSLLDSDLAKLQKLAEKNAAQTDKQQKELAENQKKLESAEDYLRANSNDSALPGQLTAIEDQLKNLVPAREKVEKQCKKIEKAEKELKKLTNQAGKAAKDLQKTSDVHLQAQNELKTLAEKLEAILAGKLLREYRSEREHLLQQLLLIKHIISLEEERKNLQDGAPCPLCGATDHPFARGNVPEAGETDLRRLELEKIITDAEMLESEIAAKKEENQILSTTKAEKEKKLGEINFQIEGLNEKISEMRGELESMQKDLADARQNLQQRLQPLGISELEDTDPTIIIAPLKLRLENWQANSSTKDLCHTKIESLNAELKSLAQAQQEYSESIAAKNSGLHSLNLETAALEKQRHELFGDKLPDQEEHKQKELLESCETEHKALQEKFTLLEKRKGEISAIIKSLSEDIATRKPQLEEKSASFRAELTNHDFTDEPAFLAARIERPEREKLQKAAQDIDAEKEALQTRFKDRHESLERLIKDQLTEQTLEFHQNELGKASDQLKQVAQRIGALRQKLLENEQQAIRLAEKKNLIEAQSREFERWDRLYRLIGSADGKKYQKFAQGLTFELLLKHANQQLTKLSDRYLLVHSREKPLELDVIDNYQAGEIRSSKNLSGGESFVVSLALALGLSTMASQKLAVDSLFLDEGFGTLDEDALDTALTTLSGLQREGKMIGVISHVTVLKDRIPTQIQIERGDFGRSTIEGPGVKRL